MWVRKYTGPVDASWDLVTGLRIYMILNYSPGARKAEHLPFRPIRWKGSKFRTYLVIQSDLFGMVK